MDCCCEHSISACLSEKTGCSSLGVTNIREHMAYYTEKPCRKQHHGLKVRQNLELSICKTLGVVNTLAGKPFPLIIQL